MFFVIEIVLFLSGAYCLASGRAPTVLFGGPQYETKGVPARLVGLLLMLPLPAVFGLAFAMAGIARDRFQAEFIVGITEMVILLIVPFAAIVAVRMTRSTAIKPDQTGKLAPAMSPLEIEIARKVNFSTMYIALGGLGLAGIFLCPLAYWRTTQALKMIHEHNVGGKYLGRAQTVRMIALPLSGLWLCATAYGLYVLYGVLQVAMRSQ